MSYKIIEAITTGQMTDDMDRAEWEGYRYLGTLTGPHAATVIMHKQAHGATQERLSNLLQEAVCAVGSHHKQWYLEQIAEGLEVTLPEHEEGIPS